jgi:hypothetical protein
LVRCGLRILRYVVAGHCTEQLRQASTVQGGYEIGNIRLSGRQRWERVARLREVRWQSLAETVRG